MIYLFDWGDTLMKDDPKARGPMALWDKVRLCPNAKPMLESLCRKNDLHLATNAKDSNESDIRKALDRVGIGTFIQNIFCFRNLGVSKPSTAFFNAVIQSIGCEPYQITMVGDNPVNDVKWALDHGADAILYDPEGVHRESGYKTIRDLMDLCGGGI